MSVVVEEPLQLGLGDEAVSIDIDSFESSRDEESRFLSQSSVHVVFASEGSQDFPQSILKHLHGERRERPGVSVVGLSPVKSISRHSVQGSDQVGEFRESQFAILVPVELSVSKLDLSSVGIDSMFLQGIRELESEDLSLSSLIHSPKSVEEVEIISQSKVLLSSLGFVFELSEASEGPEEVELFGRGEGWRLVSVLLGRLFFLLLFLFLFNFFFFLLRFSLALFFLRLLSLLLLSRLFLLRRSFLEFIHVKFPRLELRFRTLLLGFIW